MSHELSAPWSSVSGQPVAPRPTGRQWPPLTPLFRCPAPPPLRCCHSRQVDLRMSEVLLQEELQHVHPSSESCVPDPELPVCLSAAEWSGEQQWSKTALSCPISIVSAYGSTPHGPARPACDFRHLMIKLGEARKSTLRKGPSLSHSPLSIWIRDPTSCNQAVPKFRSISIIERLEDKRKLETGCVLGTTFWPIGHDCTWFCIPEVHILGWLACCLWPADSSIFSVPSIICNICHPAALPCLVVSCAAVLGFRHLPSGSWIWIWRLPDFFRLLPTASR